MFVASAAIISKPTFYDSLLDAVVCLPVSDLNMTKLDFRLAIALLNTRVHATTGFVIPYLYINNNIACKGLSERLRESIVSHFLQQENEVLNDQTFIGLRRGCLKENDSLSEIGGFARWQCEVIKDYKLNPIVRRDANLYLWGARYWLDGAPYLNRAVTDSDKLPAVTPAILKTYC